jgi:hypothetical protein
MTVTKIHSVKKNMNKTCIQANSAIVLEINNHMWCNTYIKSLQIQTCVIIDISIFKSIHGPINT